VVKMERITKAKITEIHSNKRNNSFQFKTEGMKWHDWRTINYDQFECEIPHMRKGTKIKIIENEWGTIVGIGV
jgi:hypothetical protein